MDNSYLLWALIFFTISTVAVVGEKNVKSFDSLFNEISFDELHVFPSKFIPVGPAPKIKPMVKEIKKSSYDFFQFKPGVKYYAVSKFNIDAAGRFKGYLIGSAERAIDEEAGNFKTAVYLYIYSTNEKKFTAKMELAKYDMLQTCYEETINSWIIHINDDKSFDIVKYSYIFDFEGEDPGNPDTKNITGGKMTVWYFSRGKYSLRYVNSDKYSKFISRLRK